MQIPVAAGKYTLLVKNIRGFLFLKFVTNIS